MRLPIINSTRTHVGAAVATVLACAVMYFIPQHWQFARPVELLLTPLDRAIPFWPDSGVVYFSVFAFLLATFLALRDREQVSRFLYASLLAQVIGMACFLFWPTQYPRELYPLPPGTGALGTALVNHARAADAPLNCLPSLHVCTITLCILVLRGRRWFGVALPAGVMIAASTLTFKQHYMVDAVSGAALGFAAWWACFAWQGLRLR